MSRLSKAELLKELERPYTLKTIYPTGPRRKTEMHKFPVQRVWLNQRETVKNNEMAYALRSASPAPLITRSQYLETK